MPSAFSSIQLSKGRLEALSDGLFAIVMTLLVLELKIPELPKGVSDAELIHKLRELGPALFSFFITFILSSSFWLLHHLSFHFIRHTTRALCWINLIFLMFVSLLPFSTALLGHHLGRQVVLFIYFGNEMMVGLGLLVHWRYAISRGLLHTEADPRAVRKLTERITTLPIAFAAALVTTAIRPEFAMFGFMIVGLGLRIIQRRSKD